MFQRMFHFSESLISWKFDLAESDFAITVLEVKTSVENIYKWSRISYNPKKWDRPNLGFLIT